METVPSHCEARPQDEFRPFRQGYLFPKVEKTQQSTKIVAFLPDEPEEKPLGSPERLPNPLDSSSEARWFLEKPKAES